MKNNRYNSEENRGRTCVELWRKNPELLRDLLGNFYDTSRRGVFLRRILLALNVPPDWLESVGGWIINSVGKEKWSAFLQQYCFWRGVRRAVRKREIWQRLTQGVPILMYHAFGKKGETATRFVLPIQKFTVQMWWLKFLKYHVISLDEYLKCLRGAHLLPAPCVVVTIDDGYEDNYCLAYPVLKRFGFPATIFLVSNYIGKANTWDENSVLTGRALFDIREAKEMRNSSISFGAHTCTHAFLGRLPQERLQEEIGKSKADLELCLEVPVRSFSYPYGMYDRNAMVAVEKAGFDGACTTDTGLNTFQTSTFALHRVEIYGTFSILRFLHAVWWGE